LLVTKFFGTYQADEKYKLYLFGELEKKRPFEELKHRYAGNSKTDFRGMWCEYEGRNNFAHDRNERGAEEDTENNI
jgi:hypothetical protein